MCRGVLAGRWRRRLRWSPLSPERLPWLGRSRERTLLGRGWQQARKGRSQRRWPRSELAGDTATYANVLPETDLQLRATRDGFAQVLIVKSRAAATNPALGRIRLTTQTRGLSLTVDADGATAAVDSTGAVVFAAGMPTMWDSTDAVSASQQDPAKSLGGAQRSTAWAPGAAAHRSAMRVHASAGELVVEPDRAKLTAPDARYPYYIDPSWA